MKFDIEHLCTLAVIVNVVHIDAKIQTETCTLGDRHYLVGETWNPKLQPFEENSCVNCTCLIGGDVKCNGIECPKPDCKEPRILRGRCCPTCEIRKEDKKRVRADYPGCDFHGIHYDDGDIFPSNKTAIKAKHINQCVLCACHRGDVICHLKTCLPSHKCRKTMKVNDDCCLKCEEAQAMEEFTKIFSDTLNHTLEEGDCLLTTGRQRNGTTWKPVIGQYGEIHCIVCTCINGQINCGRLQCQEESDQKCNTPSVGSSGCCQPCSAKTRLKAYTARKRTRCRQNTMDKKDKTNCVSKKTFSRNKRNRKKIVHGENSNVIHAQEHIYNVRHKLCIFDKTQHILYHINRNNTESLSFDWLLEDTIEYVHWTVRKGRVQNIERRLVTQPEELRRNITVAEILGAVQNNDVRKFFKQLERIQQRCKKKCKRKILDKAIKNLRLQKLDLTKSCDI